MEVDCWKSCGTKNEMVFIVYVNTSFAIYYFQCPASTEWNKNATVINNNVFLNSASGHEAPDHLEHDDRAHVPTSDGDQNHVSENSENNLVIAEDTLHLDDSFVKMINTTYREMSVILPTTGASVTSSRRVSVIRGSSSTQYPVPLAASSPKRDTSGDDNILLQCSRLLDSPDNDSFSLLRTSLDNNEWHSVLANGPHVQDRAVTSTHSYKFSDSNQPHLLPINSDQCGKQSVIFPRTQESLLLPHLDLTIGRYFSSFSPDETTIRKISSIPVPGDQTKLMKHAAPRPARVIKTKSIR